MKHSLTVVTNSELGTFRDCPQLHHFVYREGLRPKVRARALALGSVIHDGLAAGLREGWGPLRAAHVTNTAKRVQLQIAAAESAVRAGLARWHAEVELSQDDPNYEALDIEAQATVELALFMVGHYFRTSSSDLTELRLVDVETPFNVPVRDKLGRARALRFAGVRDALYYDPAYDQLVLDEHKTCTGDPRQLEKRVEMDPQTTGYVWAVKEHHAEGRLKFFGTDEPVPASASVGRIRYNALRKAFPRIPQVNKTDNRVSVAAIDTMPEVYADALAEQVARGLPVTEKQAELLQRLREKGDTYMARVEYHRTADELERWRWETFTDASRIREAERDASRRTRNTGHCNMAWSLPCRYRAVCLDPNAPELRAEFRVAADRHTEVVEAINAAEG